MTAQDLKQHRQAKKRGAEAAPATGGTPGSDELLTFDSTSVNMGLFQQASIVRSWWAQVERRHDLGFCSRFLFSFCKRASLQLPARVPASERAPGLRAPLTCAAELCLQLWRGVCQAHGHAQTSTPRPLLFCRSQELAMENLFLAMEPLMAGQEWGTAVRGLLGKFEYVVAAQAAFIQMQENAFSRVTRHKR